MVDVRTEIPLNRFGDWTTPCLMAIRELEDGMALTAYISRSLDKEGQQYWFEASVCRTIYGSNGIINNNKLLKRETFGYLWDAVRFCETVDLGEIETTNE